MSKAPAFQLYAADFYMDTAHWEPETIGVYFRLLMFEWVNGFIPNDTKQLSRIAGITQKKFKNNWKIFSHKFSQKDDEKLINRKMEEVREEQENYRKSQKESGKRGAEKRWKKDSDPNGDPIGDPNGEKIALQSSSSNIFINKYIYSLFEKWNSLKILQHRDIEKFKPNLKSALKNYKPEEIEKAMDNYALVYRGDEYFWSYKWGLREFLQRGIDRFIPTNFTASDFKRKEQNGRTQNNFRRDGRAEVQIDPEVAEAQRKWRQQKDKQGKTDDTG